MLQGRDDVRRSSLRAASPGRCYPPPVAGQHPYPPSQGQDQDPYADPYADASEDWPEPDEAIVTRRRRRGLHIGPLDITPTRVTLLVALIGSTAFLVYAITVRDLSQIPLLASGAAVLGIVFGALALSGVMGSVRAGRTGHGGRAFALSVGGGIAALIAAGCLAASIVLALVWRT